jgi:hypothetical protein
MREIRPYGSEGGGAGCSPYPYQDLDAHSRSLEAETGHRPTPV